MDFLTQLNAAKTLVGWFIFFSIFVFCFSSVTVFALVFVFIVIHSHIHFIWHVCGNCVHFPNWIESHLQWQSPTEQFKQLDFRNRFYYFRIIDCNLFKEFVIDHPGCNLRMIISFQGISSSCQMFSTLSKIRRAGPPPAWSISPSVAGGEAPWDGPPAVAWKSPPGVQWKRQSHGSTATAQLNLRNIPKWGHFVKQPWHKLTIKTSALSDDQNSGVPKDMVSFFWGPKFIYLEVYSLRDETTWAKPRVLSSKLVELVRGGILPPCLFTKSVPLLRLYWIKWWNN